MTSAKFLGGLALRRQARLPEYFSSSFQASGPNLPRHSE
jgi:hypothetical protein